MYIRPIQASDREPLAALLRRIENFTPGEADVALELIDESLRRPELSGYRCMVSQESETGGEITGYLCWGPTPMTEAAFDLYWVAVDGKYRGRGIGGRLVEELEARVREENGRIVRIETSSQETYGKTLDFYLGRNYEVIGRIPDFYRDGDDLITLCKRVR